MKRLKGYIKNRNVMQEIGSPSLPIGFEFFSMNPNGVVGALPLLGATYSKTAFGGLWAWVQTQTEYLKTETEWQALSIANNGNVPFYADVDADTFRVPSLKCYVKGANGVTEIGSYKEAGLPNITGELTGLTFYNDVGGGSVAFKYKYDNGVNTAASTQTWKDTGVSIDASRSSSIYGKSTTVTPESIVGCFYVQAFGTVSNVGNVDVQDVASGLVNVENEVEQLAGNISRLVGASEVVENGTGYIRWSNGIQLCWGYGTTNTQAYVTISYPKAFRYLPTVVTTPVGSSGALLDFFTGVLGITETYCTLLASRTGYSYGVEYYALGRWK